MKVIDWERKGNLVRLYFGKDKLKEWFGDDWDDIPYECNAGEVYDKFVGDILDVCFGYDMEIYEPCHNKLNSEWCKDDFINNKSVVLVISKEYYSTFEGAVMDEVNLKISICDDLDILLEKLVNVGTVVYHREEGKK
jgi:hypothetical protein